MALRSESLAEHPRDFLRPGVLRLGLDEKDAQRPTHRGDPFAPGSVCCIASRVESQRLKCATMPSTDGSIPVQRRQSTLRTAAVTRSDAVVAMAAPVSPNSGIRIANPVRR